MTSHSQGPRDAPVLVVALLIAVVKRGDADSTRWLRSLVLHQKSLVVVARVIVVVGEETVELFLLQRARLARTFRLLTNDLRQVFRLDQVLTRASKANVKLGRKTQVCSVSV